MITDSCIISCIFNKTHILTDYKNNKVTHCDYVYFCDYCSMVNKILGTTGTRMLNAAFNLLILIVLTQELGSAGFGTISLIILALTFIQLFIDLLAGSGIIYYTSRKPLAQLLFPAYGWILFSVSLYFLFTQAGKSSFPELLVMLIPTGFENHILYLSLLNATMLLHYNVLIGQTRIKTYNLIFVVQITALLLSVIVWYYILNEKVVESFVFCLYISYGVCAVLSFVSILPALSPLNISGWQKASIAVFKYGFVSQVANLLHIGNKRVSYYILRYFGGLPAVGIYGVGVQLTEGLRLIGQSISLVQFSTIAGQNENNYAARLTIRLMKLSVGITFFALLVLIVIPTDFYLFLFKKDFADLKSLIVALSPGVLALSANTIFSGYFAGTGKPVVSLKVNAVGFVITLITAIPLIAIGSYIGAAVAASVSYSITVLAQYFIFKKETKTTLKDWLISRDDWIEIKSMIFPLLKTNRSS